MIASNVRTTTARRDRNRPLPGFAAADVTIVSLVGLAADHPLVAAFPDADAVYLRPRRASDAPVADRCYLDAAGAVHRGRDVRADVPLRAVVVGVSRSEDGALGRGDGGGWASAVVQVKRALATLATA